MIYIYDENQSYWQLREGLLNTHELFKRWTPSPVHTEFKPAYPNTELELIQEWEVWDGP